ncbi:MAG: bifunctional riboflavin kinase/FAD synthetase [Actinomycetota bacterium]
MEIRRGLDALPRDGTRSVVTIGFFDGVHRGHRGVLARTVEAARDRDARSAAITFDRHPREVLTPGSEPRLLTTTERKAQLIAESGIDTLVVLEFTPEFSGWPTEAFVERVLVEGLSAVHIAVGGNFTFGHRALGNVAMLRALGPARGFTVEEVPLLRLDGRIVSSSSIRAALAEGDLSWPTTALGRPHAVDGVVVTGAGRGHLLGYPTANLRAFPRLLLPKVGIYAGRARTSSGAHLAAISVGTNPTFGIEPLHIEAFLLDFEGDLVNQPISVEFIARLRDEERFDTPAALVDAIATDVRRTRAAVPPAP